MKFAAQLFVQDGDTFARLRRCHYQGGPQDPTDRECASARFERRSNVILPDAPCARRAAVKASRSVQKWILVYDGGSTFRFCTSLGSAWFALLAFVEQYAN